jgi:hypothetical protein
MLTCEGLGHKRLPSIRSPQVRLGQSRRGSATVASAAAFHRLRTATGEHRGRARGGRALKTPVSPDTRSWPRRNLGPLAVGAAGVVVVIVASAFAPPSTPVSSPTGLANRQVQPQRDRAPVRERTAAQPSHIQNPHVLPALIKAAASVASSNRVSHPSIASTPLTSRRPRCLPVQ